MRLIVSPMTPGEISPCLGMFAECPLQGLGHVHFECLVPFSSEHPCFRSARITSRSFIALDTTLNLAPLDVNMDCTRE